MPQTAIATAIFGATMAPVAATAVAAAVMAQAVTVGTWDAVAEKFGVALTVSAVSAVVAIYLGKLVINRSLAQSDADRSALTTEIEDRRKADKENLQKWIEQHDRQLLALTKVEQCLSDVTEAIRGCRNRQA